MNPDVPTISIGEILERYDALFLDAYGVLIHDTGPIPGARELIARLESEDRPYLVLTNDASRSPSECAARYESYGVSVPAERVITSGSLIADYLRAHDLDEPRAIVLGSPSAVSYVESLGITVVEPDPEVEFDLVIPCGTRGYEFVELIDGAISAVFHALDRGRSIDLLLPNPDVIYPRAEGAFGFTAGGIAHLLEAALAVRFPGTDHRFEHLGKPGTPIFEAAIEHVGTTNAIMIGDQLGTDIAGARAAGIDSALVKTGVAGLARLPIAPTWLLGSLAE